MKLREIILILAAAGTGIFALAVHNRTSMKPLPYLKRVPARKIPYAIEITEPNNILVGQYPEFQIEVTNIIDQTVGFVRPLDGSWAHWRYPKLSASLVDQNGKSIPLKTSPRCGNMNPMVMENIDYLKPGEKKKYSIGWPFWPRGFDKPGKYKVSFSYDLKAPNKEAWRILGRASNGKENPKLAKQLKKIPKVLIKTKPFEIEVHKVTDQMVTNMILQFYAKRGPDFAFIAKDHKQMKWHVSDIRQKRRHISCLVKLEDGYEETLKAKNINARHQLASGRYIFKHAYTPSGYSAQALPDLSKKTHFRLLFPDEAKSFLKRHKYYESLASEDKK